MRSDFIFQKCLFQQLQREGVAELLPRQPTSVYVRDLLAISRGLMPPTMHGTKTRSEPSMKKEKVPRKEIDRVKYVTEISSHSSKGAQTCCCSKFGHLYKFIITAFSVL